MDPSTESVAEDPGSAPPMTPGTRRLIAWGVVVLVVGASVFVFDQLVTRFPGGQKQRAICLGRLSQLGLVFLMHSSAAPDKAPPHSGPALFLSWRKDRSEIARGYEKVLICPLDDLADVPETDAEKRAWDDVDLAHPPRSLCSYAVRDFERFPLESKDAAPHPIAACLHHPGIAIVGFDSGEARPVKLDELGLASDDEKIVGPSSKSPLLRVLRFGDGSVR